MRRHDLVAEIYHLREPQAIAVVLAPEEVVQVLACAPSLKARVMLTIGYGCGLRGGEVTLLAAHEFGRSRWLGISDLITEPEGPTFISSTVAQRRVDRRCSHKTQT